MSQCPLCLVYFPESEIALHANKCADKRMRGGEKNVIYAPNGKNYRISFGRKEYVPSRPLLNVARRLMGRKESERKESECLPPAPPPYFEVDPVNIQFSNGQSSGQRSGGGSDCSGSVQRGGDRSGVQGGSDFSGVQRGGVQRGSNTFVPNSSEFTNHVNVFDRNIYGMSTAYGSVVPVPVHYNSQWNQNLPVQHVNFGSPTPHMYQNQGQPNHHPYIHPVRYDPQNGYGSQSQASYPQIPSQIQNSHIQNSYVRHDVNQNTDPPIQNSYGQRTYTQNTLNSNHTAQLRSSYIQDPSHIPIQTSYGKSANYTKLRSTGESYPKLSEIDQEEERKYTVKDHKSTMNNNSLSRYSTSDIEIISPLPDYKLSQSSMNSGSSRNEKYNNSRPDELRMSQIGILSTESEEIDKEIISLEQKLEQLRATYNDQTNQ